MSPVAVLLPFLLAAAPPAVSSSAVPDTLPARGEEVIRRMYDRYAGTWYRTLTFVQKTSFADGRVETWYEAAALPGKLRIDIAPIDSGRAIVFRNDTLYQIRQGKLAGARPLVHPLLVLGFDVYAQPVAKTVAQLAELKVDLSKVHETSWQGRPVWVVGAAAGDTTSNQFWVDRERLLFVRLLQTVGPGPQGRTALNETQFNKYVPLGGGWIAPEVIFKTDGKQTLIEEYSDMKADPPLDPTLWDAAAYRKPGWVQ